MCPWRGVPRSYERQLLELAALPLRWATRWELPLPAKQQQRYGALPCGLISLHWRVELSLGSSERYSH